MKKRRNKHSFLCIDDDVQLASLCKAMEINTSVKLKPEPPPTTWEAAIDELTNRLIAGNFEGLLLDFRLDEYPIGANKVKVRYTAESLVNELRRRSVEGEDRSYPIVLWSTADNLSWYFSINPSYTGLYDGIWDKEEARRNAAQYGTLLASLADGYRLLHTAAQKKQPLHSVLDCQETAVLAEMEQAFISKIRQAPYTFNYATFIINRILRYNGVLIDHETAAALLGVSDVSSASHVLDKISVSGADLHYSGVFCRGYSRIWRDELLNQLNQLSNGGHWLHLPAKERVRLLTKCFRLRKLVAADPIHASYQTDFDCICERSRRPLARRNGYRLHSVVLDPWIQPRYIAGTIYRTMPKSEAKGIRLDVGEQERFDSDFGT